MTSCITQAAVVRCCAGFTDLVPGAHFCVFVCVCCVVWPRSHVVMAVEERMNIQLNLSKTTTQGASVTWSLLPGGLLIQGHLTGYNNIP